MIPAASAGPTPREVVRAEPAPPRAARGRLLILVSALGAGGAERVLVALAPRLKQEGFEVTVAALGDWGPLGDDLLARGVRAVALGRRSPLDPRAAGRLLSILRRERIQIVHAQRFAAALPARLLGRAAAVPIVITAQHDTGARVPFIRRLAERLTASLSDAVIAPSEEARRQAIAWSGLRPGTVRTVRAAIEVPGAPPDRAERDRLRRDLGAAAGDLLVGTAGRFDAPREGPAVFLAAARLLARDVPRVRFALFGEGPPPAWLEACAAREGVSHRTTLVGPGRALGETLRALDLYVQPAPWEDAGLGLLEAMAGGVPAVAARARDLPEALDEETGVLVPPGDPEALARACALALGDRERTALRADAARARLEGGFRIERLVSDLSGLYRELLDRGRPSTAAGEAE
jgi:glycosyltransferase involved in cell wall biosynthesis